MHFESKHESFVCEFWTHVLCLAAYESERNTIQQPTEASRKQLPATYTYMYEVAYITCKHKHPFATAEDFMEFARIAYLLEVFSGTAASRCTITRRIEETADYVLRS